MKTSIAIILTTIWSSVSAFTPSTPLTTATTATTQSSTSLNAQISRSNFVKYVTGSTAAAAASSILLGNPIASLADDGESITLPSGVSYIIKTAGKGPKPTVGELAAIRFKANVLQTGNLIDDIFETPEPYYTRVGSGGLIKGVEEVLPKMVVGDRFLIKVPTNLAFGPKGRPSSAGKPRIPGDAIIMFEVEMVGLPGKEEELIDLIGDD